MSLKNALQRAAGLFVEQDNSPADPLSFDPTPSDSAEKPRTVEQIVKDAPGPNLDEIHVPAQAAKEQPLLNPDGSPNFPAIFAQAGVPQVPFGAEEALQVIHSLPGELPIDMRRKTVGATLSAMGKTMGVSTDTVVADASRKLAALASYSDQLTSQTNQFGQTVDQRVADFKAQIAEWESQIANAREKLANVVKQCETEGDRLDEVLEFFTLDVSPSKHA